MEITGEKQLLADNSPYAGFGIRLLAYIIDSCLAFIGYLIIYFLVCGVCALISGQETASIFSHISLLRTNPPSEQQAAAILPYTIIFGLLILFTAVAYNAGFNSSKYMATPGKIVTGIIVVNEYGERISIWRAITRFLFYAIACSIISFAIPAKGAAQILLIIVYWGGYLNILIDTRKRGLHDMVCGTFVVYKFHNKKSKYENFFDRELP